MRVCWSRCCYLRRLRRALLDAEIDTQRSSVAAEAATKQLAGLEAELTKARSVEGVGSVNVRTVRCVG